MLLTEIAKKIFSKKEGAIPSPMEVEDDAIETVNIDPSIPDREMLEELISSQMIKIHRLEAQNTTLKKMLETQKQSIDMLRVAKAGYEEAMHIWRLSAEQNLPIEECVELIRSGQVDRTFRMH